MSALEVVKLDEPPKPMGICPVLSKLIAVPVPSSRLAPPGQQAMEIQSTMVEVPCMLSRCQMWDPGETDLNLGQCGLKEKAKCLTNI